MSAFGRAAAQATCVCCKNFGELPHLPGLPQAVDGEVVKQMCDECIDAAFLSGGTRPHPHPFIHAQQSADPCTCGVAFGTDEGPCVCEPRPADLVQGDAKLRGNSGDADATENHENGRSER